MAIHIVRNVPDRSPLNAYLKTIVMLAGLGITYCVIAQQEQVSGQPEPADDIPGLFNPAPLNYSFDTTGATVEFNINGEPQPVLTGINIQEHSREFKNRTIETILQPGQQLEYMANMDRGDVVIYSWESDGSIYYDLHGHQENADPDIWIRYKEATANGGHGSFTAPYQGEHGWYLANLNNKPVRLVLSISGFYQNLFRVDL